MRVSESYDLLTEFRFPMRVERLTDEIGEETLEAPDGTVETVGEVLRRTGEGTVDSADEAYHLLVCGVRDGFVGRKYYDDRSSNPDHTDHVSF